MSQMASTVSAVVLFFFLRKIAAEEPNESNIALIRRRFIFIVGCFGRNANIKTFIFYVASESFKFLFLTFEIIKI